MQFKKEFSICLIELEAWLKAIGIQELQKTIEQRVIHFANPNMHLESHISGSIWQMGSGDNFITDSSEQLNISNLNEAC